MPLTLNRYSATHLEYFSLKDQTIDGTVYAKGDKITNPQGLPKLEMLVRTKRVVPVTSDRNLQPKMWYRELRSPEFVQAKYGFLPVLSAGVADDYDPADHTIPEVQDFVADYPVALGAVLVSEVANKNRSTLVTSLQTSALAMVSVAPTSGTAAGGTAVSITATSTNIDAALASVTAVKFATTNGTSFGYATGTISVTTPAHAAGAVNVVLVGFPGGDLTKTNAFTYV